MALELFDVDILDLRADPNRPIVYGLQTKQSASLQGHIIAIDSATGDYLWSKPLDDYSSHFAVHPLEDRLYVSLSLLRRLQVFDLSSGEELPSIEVTNVANIGGVTPGRTGRIFVEVGGLWATHQIDTNTGEDLGVAPPQPAHIQRVLWRQRSLRTVLLQQHKHEHPANRRVRRHSRPPGIRKRSPELTQPRGILPLVQPQ